MTRRKSASLTKTINNIYDGHVKRTRKYGVPLNYTRDDLRKFIEHMMRGGCGYCGEKLDVTNVSVDHEKPVSRSRNFEMHNLTVCCQRCNLAKGIMDGNEFCELLTFLSRLPADVKVDTLARLRLGARSRR